MFFLHDFFSSTFSFSRESLTAGVVAHQRDQCTAATLRELGAGDCCAESGEVIHGDDNSQIEELCDGLAVSGLTDSPG